MIRVLGLLLIFILGIAGGAVWKGQMHHLRKALPANLPAWTEMLRDDAGVLSGAAELPAQGRLPELSLSWHATAPGTEGLNWAVQVQGEGVDLAGTATLNFWPDEGILRGERGSLDLGKLAGADAEIEGLVALRGLEARVSGLLSKPQVQGEFEGEARSLGFDETALGDGPVMGQLDADSAWQVTVELTGGVAPLTSILKGAGLAPTATLDLTIEDADALPPGIREAVARFGELQNGTLNASLPVPLY